MNEKDLMKYLNMLMHRLNDIESVIKKNPLDWYNRDGYSKSDRNAVLLEIRKTALKLSKI